VKGSWREEQLKGFREVLKYPLGQGQDALKISGIDPRNLQVLQTLVSFLQLQLGWQPFAREMNIRLARRSS